jgi:hypothetical protein
MSHRRSNVFVAVAAVALACIPGTDARAEIFCVGRGASTHASLQAAVDAAAANGPALDHIFLDEITHAVPERVLIGYQSLVILGGFPVCQTGLAPTGIATLDGAGGSAGSVVEIRADDALQHTVDIDRVVVRGGENDGGGGGLHLFGNGLAVRLGPMTLVTANTSAIGGGIFAQFARLHLDGASIVGNSAAAVGQDVAIGGGVDCFGARIEVEAASSVRFNDARAGGGFSLRNLCELTFHGGNALSLFGNSADESGGGILATGSARITVTRGRPDSSTPVGRDGALRIGANIATLRGAGIALEQGARLDAGGLVMVANNLSANAGAVDVLGGAIHAGADTEVLLHVDPRCAPGEACNALINNVVNRHLTSLSAGGAALAAIGARRVQLEQTQVSGNDVNGGNAVASAILVVDAEQSARFSRVQIDNNGTADGSAIGSTLALDGVPDATLHFMTLADNEVSAPGAVVARFSDIAMLDWRASLIDETGDTTAALASVGIARIDCLLATELASVPLQARSHLGSATFVDRGNGDYRAAPGSDQIDFCDGPAPPEVAAPQFDLDLSPVPQDAITVDLYGRYDVGAYESQQFLEPAMFANGFEDP